MNFEELLREVGGFGRFQILTLLLLCLPRFFLPLHFLLHNFLAATPGHHCAIPHQQQFANLTEEEVLLINIPRDFNGAFSSCEMFSEPQLHLLLNSSLELTNVSVQSCQYGWTYDQSQFISTIATQWDLVCEHKSLNQATATYFFFGVMFGAVIFGDLSDRFGRKRMLLVSYLGTLIFGIMSSASVSYSMFAVTRTLTGMSICGLSIIVIPLGMEWVDIEHRTMSGVITSLFWSFGNMFLALIAYLVRDWHWLLLTTSLPFIVGIISMWWLSESARWLLIKGKLKEAHRDLKRCAKMNRRKEFADKINPESLLKTAAVISQKSDGNYSYISLFRTPILRRISFCLGVVWFGAAFSYYIVSMNISGFGLGMYMTQFVFGFIEVPAKLLVFVMVNRVGRRKSQAGALILSGLFMGINLIVPTSQGILRSVVAIIGKGFSEAAITIVFLYSSELYPTILRQSGQGYCSFMARLGASVAPLVFLLDSIWKPLPQVASFAMAVLCGSSAFFLPETRGICLPETIEDIEKRSSEGKKHLHGDTLEVAPLQLSHN
ncbi:solute carrier family 22 member 7 [Protobothrops mucrosquamatus]|uniref:solute carrier family 22 member 7 n=1 Tax=Protobothrops mucrosquamatus TaxID=103944 RepID=UPI000775C681|nr:solute carrier family 22 member 7 [Protobothrops mucrosquamatus]